MSSTAGDLDQTAFWKFPASAGDENRAPYQTVPAIDFILRACGLESAGGRRGRDFVPQSNSLTGVSPGRAKRAWHHSTDHSFSGKILVA